jgi:methylenetetrahydrofolate dehydrogenase (NADP+) / methenyltetrahydrofolate cyclohydrolase
MILIDGKQTAADIRAELTEKVSIIKEKGGKVPHLAIMLIGDDPASDIYVRNKIKACEAAGFGATLIRYGADVSEKEVLDKIEAVNQNKDIDGLIVQSPFPDHISAEKVTFAIDPRKDVDGFHPVNIGRMAKGLPAYVAATPFGIVELLKRYEIETSGKHCVVIGRSDIVGTPMALLMSRKAYPGNCTVTICHSRTKDLPSITRQADILIAALGKPEIVTADMVKEGVVIIDVGTSRVEDASKKSGYGLKGDVKFDEVAEKASYITPVPGGVGPMTIASLMYNTWLASQGEIY